MHAIYGFVVFLWLIVLCGCTDNLWPKKKPSPVVYTPVHYTLTDTVPQKTMDTVVAVGETETAQTPKIVHKALCRLNQKSIAIKY